MDKESQICGLCSIAYNTTDRIPRILITCAHTLCSPCLVKIIDTPDSRKCPFDSLAFSEAQKSLENFPLNFALLALLEGQKQNICQTHGGKLTDICVQDKVKICSDCALFGEHRGHPIKKIKELKAKGIKVKKDLEEGLMKFEENQLKKDQDVKNLKSRCMGKMGNKFGEINKILKDKQLEWRRQMESLFERNVDQSLLKEEVSKVIEEIDQAVKKEENLTSLDRDFSSIISKLHSQVWKEEISKLSDEASIMINSIGSFLASQGKSLKNFDLSNEKESPEEPIIKEIPEQKQQEDHQQLSSEKLIETKQELRLPKSVLRFGIRFETLKIWVNNKKLINQIIDLDFFNKMERVNVVFEEYDFLFQNSNDLDYLHQTLQQLNNYTELVVEFQPSGLTDERALSLLKILFPRIQHLTDIEVSFGKCEITNQPISFFCADILPQATSLKFLTLRLDSTLINDLSLPPFNKSLETFKLEARYTQITDDVIEKIIHSFEGIKVLDLDLQGTGITDRSLKVLGNSSCMKNLKIFMLDVGNTRITMEGVNVIFTGIPKDIDGLVLNFEGIILPDEVTSLFEEKVCPKLKLVEHVFVRLEGTDLEAKMSKILREITMEVMKRGRLIKTNKEKIVV